jgi:hypothetical protein
VRPVPSWKDSISMTLQDWCKGNYGLYFSTRGSLNTEKNFFLYRTQRLSWIAEK